MELPIVGFVALNRLIALAVVLLVVVVVVPRLFRKGPTSTHLVPARCQKCGWTGSVSKYKPVCPSCGARIQI
ncbi:MAG: hypothetical protein ACJ790_14810 [Myxococcaceae bacterium]